MTESLRRGSAEIEPGVTWSQNARDRGGDEDRDADGQEAAPAAA